MPPIIPTAQRRSGFVLDALMRFDEPMAMTRAVDFIARLQAFLDNAVTEKSLTGFSFGRRDGHEDAMLRRSPRIRRPPKPGALASTTYGAHVKA